MVVIFRGVSGIGKSSVIKAMTTKGDIELIGTMVHLFDEIDAISQKAENLPVVVCSADLFFVDTDGNYNFNADRLGDAHNWCMRNFIDATQSEIEKLVIVDNTNCSTAEVSPYVAIASAYEHATKIIAMLGNPYECAVRNVHKAPHSVIARQDLILRDSLLHPPAWWGRTQQIYYV
jgi:hypothetical protein